MGGRHVQSSSSSLSYPAQVGCHEVFQTELEVLNSVAAECSSSQSALAVLQCEDTLLYGILNR